ncbi:MAG: hypothetical protein Q4D55_09085 [Eubacteriales bacterium]|nr:hypothetical protein [Eubacteriales bacterium]
MRKLTTHSRSSLFLMEMIISILFLSLSCSVCIRIFFISHTNQQRARELNHIQALSTSAGEVLEGTDGSMEAFLKAFPGGEKEDASLCYYYAADWEPCSADEFSYRLEVRFSSSSPLKEAELLFSDRQGQELYRLPLAFWAPGPGKEAQS